MKTYNAWAESRLDLDKFLQIGDAVDQEMADYFLNVLPPATMLSALIQIGEPYSHVKGRATFSTIRKVDGTWVYCGHCWRGQFTEATSKPEWASGQCADCNQYLCRCGGSLIAHHRTDRCV